MNYKDKVELNICSKSIESIQNPLSSENNYYIKQIRLEDIKLPLKIKQVNGYLLIDYLMSQHMKFDLFKIMDDMIKHQDKLKNEQRNSDNNI